MVLYNSWMWLWLVWVIVASVQHVWVKVLIDSLADNQLINMQSCGHHHHSPFAAWLIKVYWETKVAVLRARKDSVAVQIQVKATDVIRINKYGQKNNKKTQTDFQPLLHFLWDTCYSRTKPFRTILSARKKVMLFCSFGRARYHLLYYSVVFEVNMTLVGMFPMCFLQIKWGTCHGFPWCSVSILWHLLLGICWFKVTAVNFVIRCQNRNTQLHLQLSVHPHYSRETKNTNITNLPKITKSSKQTKREEQFSREVTEMHAQEVSPKEIMHL